jgi:glucosamine kinase
MPILIADSGSTKCEWCVVSPRSKASYFTQGMSPYFLDAVQMEGVIRTELFPQLKKHDFEAVYFYGTGTKDPNNARKVKAALQKVFGDAVITVNHDLIGAARALCEEEKGIACILGTGSNSCYFDGKKIKHNSPGIGFILGDEGSGAYLGKKLIQYYLYGIFEKELKEKFEAKYRSGADDILENVYRKPLPNRYLASFTLFLSENRGHYMIENIIEDGLNDFFSMHLSRYRESRQYPVHFTGAIAWYFQDVISNLCMDYEMTQGMILKNPMEGLVKYHRP